MIELKNYSFSYDGKKQILNNINLKIKQGEFVAVTGLSGCGKTTLTRVLMGFAQISIKEKPKAITDYTTVMPKI